MVDGSKQDTTVVPIPVCKMSEVMNISRISMRKCAGPRGAIGRAPDS